MRRGAAENLGDRKILDGFIGCYSTKKCMHNSKFYSYATMLTCVKLTRYEYLINFLILVVLM